MLTVTKYRSYSFMAIVLLVHWCADGFAEGCVPGIPSPVKALRQRPRPRMYLSLNNTPASFFGSICSPCSPPRRRCRAGAWCLAAVLVGAAAGCVVVAVLSLRVRFVPAHRSHRLHSPSVPLVRPRNISMLLLRRAQEPVDRTTATPAASTQMIEPGSRAISASMSLSGLPQSQPRVQSSSDF